MATDVDICNLALGHIGDAAAVTSISPPDSTTQALHCARFYPIARDSLLEEHAWGFATVRVALAAAPTNPSTSWQYCYLAPTNVLNYLEILDSNAQDDYSTGLPLAGSVPATVQPQVGIQPAQPFVVEQDLNDNDIVLTNQANAVLRYTQVQTDTSQFSPLFIDALALRLAAMLAGPIIKGTEGRQVAMQLRQEAAGAKAAAVASDSNQRRVRLLYSTPWIVNR